MAGHKIERLGNQDLTGEEKATRKGHLIRGPREFRHMRGN